MEGQDHDFHHNELYDFDKKLCYEREQLRDALNELRDKVNRVIYVLDNTKEDFNQLLNQVDETKMESMPLEVTESRKKELTESLEKSVDVLVDASGQIDKMMLH